MNFQAKLLDWLVPMVLGLIVYYMQSMSKDFHDVSTNLAVALERIEENNRRTSALEDWRRSIEAGRTYDGSHGVIRPGGRNP